MRFTTHTALIFLLCLLFCFPVSLALAEMVSISGEKVNLRQGPGTKYKIIWELGEGYPLRVLQKKGSWLKVKDFEGDSGWIFAKLTTKKPHLVVKNDLINIRKGPGDDAKIIGKARRGVVFKTIERRTDGWVKVRHETGLTGWVQRNLLWGW